MAVKKWSVSVEATLATRVESHVGDRGSSGFVARAVEHELERDLLHEYLEVRTTPEDCGLIDRAVAVTDSDLTDFVVSNLRIAERGDEAIGSARRTGIRMTRGDRTVRVAAVAGSPGSLGNGDGRAMRSRRPDRVRAGRRLICSHA
jgi:uncharacterized protein (DUF1778 family)